jgi:post-segregation antitoxin (ccd killing protein)
MRTTLTVDDDLLRRAKQRAAESGTSVVEVINHALRRGLEEEPVRRAAETGTVTFGHVAGHATRTGPDDAALRAWQERLDDENDRAKSGRRS